MNNDQSKSAENEKAKQEEDLEDRIMKEIKEHPDRNHFYRYDPAVPIRSASLNLTTMAMEHR